MKTKLLKKYKKHFALLLFLSLNIYINFTPSGLSIGMKQAFAQDWWYSGITLQDSTIINSGGYYPSGRYIDVGNGIWDYCADCAGFGIEDVVANGVYLTPSPIDLIISDIWRGFYISPDVEEWSYWNYGSGSWVTVTNPPLTENYNSMGDPIDSLTFYPNVTDRFNNDIENAFSHFCGTSYDFGVAVDSYGSLLEGIFCYPSDFLDYVNYFVGQVQTGGPWDLKYEGNGYSISELGNYFAYYNGQVYQNDDFGNITFGIAAAAYGFPQEFAQAGAGFYQVLSGTSSWSYITSYFDDPRDAEMIALGYDIFYSNGGCSGF